MMHTVWQGCFRLSVVLVSQGVTVMVQNRSIFWVCLTFCMSLMGVVGCATRAEAYCEKSNVFLLLDVSGSMAGTKHNDVRTAIRNLTSGFQSKLRFGLSTFGANYTFRVAISDSAWSTIYNSVNSYPSNEGYTRMGTGIRSAGQYLWGLKQSEPAATKNRPYYLVLITDGYPNSESYDPVSEASTLWRSYGIKTFVIGVQFNAALLNSVASAGQTGSAYNATNQSSLNSAFNAIANTASQEVCDNLDNDCDGQVDEGLSRSCTTPCGPGTQICSKGNWGTCTANNLPAESCNGKDDNCNGLVDEDWPQRGQVCVVGTGNCQRTGLYICNSSGTGVTCSVSPGTPQNELCNGQDDNCDGRVDENWPNKGQSCSVGTGACRKTGTWVCTANGSGIECSAKAGTPQPEVCNGQDDDCNGQTDENLTRTCQTLCETGTETCQNGQWVNCTARKPTPELCNGKDDNCDGQIDENWGNKGQTCTVGLGICQRTGTWVCNANGSGVECSVKPGPSQAETCNGLDDNCDGQIDENWPNKGQPCEAGTGACKQKGQMVCTPDGSGLRCSVPGGAPSTEVCDGIDNDCNGQIDDGLIQACKTACGNGTETCQAGKWVNCTAPQPTSEVCNNQDDDCDGQVDNGLTRACQTVCGSGTEQCVSGRWVNCTAQKPEPEQCDGKDNDCNGQIDEIPDKPCLGDCGQGTATCKNGQWSGCSGPAPKAEECNGKDDDCDGKVDNNITRPCRSDCGSGTEICQNGQWTLCNAPEPQPERCNGKDDDCDGQADNGAPCPSGLVCEQGSCRQKCRNAECPGGMKCVDGICWGDPCQNIQCDAGKQCVGGRCTDPCELVNCPKGYVCQKGLCLKDDCYVQGCSQGKRCVGGYCQEDPCDGVTCGNQKFCRDGKCVDSCANVSCAAKEICQDGKCKEDPQKTGPCDGVTCPNGSFCSEGKCQADPCYDVTCAPGKSCQDGRCQHDPCYNIKCPQGQSCVAGQCQTPPGNPGESGNPGDESNASQENTSSGESPNSTTDGGNSGSDSNTSTDGSGNTNPEGGTTPTDGEDTADRISGTPNQTPNQDPQRYAPGCGCQQTPSHTLPTLLVLLLLLAGLSLRRRA